MKQSWWHWATISLACMAAAMVLIVVTGPVSAASPQPALSITEISPRSAPNDLDTTLAITGTGFVAVPTVTLGTSVLDGVDWVSGSLLTATVPWGLVPGVYTMTVANPGGGLASISGAFTVTQGIGTWNTGGPYGGRVQQVVTRPGTPSTVYAVVFCVGGFASFDGGGHWQRMLASNNPSRLAFDAQNPDIIYAGGSGLQGDTLRSMDGGQTWEVYFDELIPYYGSYVSYPAPHPTLPGVVYVATGGDSDIPVLPGEGGVYYSDDYGETWVTRTQGLTDTHLVDIAFHPTDPDVMAVASASGNVFTTTNGGLDWHWAADLGQELRRIYFNPAGAHEAWVVPYSEYQPPSIPYLFKSTSPGLSAWITTAVTAEPVPSGGIWSLAFLPDTIWAAGNRGFVSDDGGATWTPVMTGENPIATVQAFGFPPGDGQTIYVGSEMEGVTKSLDGGTTWQEKNEGLAGLQVRSLAVPRGVVDTVYAYTYERGILRSDDGGRAWLPLDVYRGGAPKGELLAADPFQPTRLYLGDTCDGTPCMRIGENRGATWRDVTMDIPTTWEGWMGEVTVVAPHPGVNGRVLAGAGFCEHLEECNAGTEPAGIYASDDHGETWSFVGPTPAISEVLSLAFDAFDPELVYAGTRGMGLWRSTDGGDSWAAVPIPGMPDEIHIVSIAPHPNVSHTVYVRLYNFVDDPNPQPNLFVSADAGGTWHELDDVDTVFGGIGGRGLVFLPPIPDAAPYLLYSGCEVGLCRSPDGGRTWEQVEGAPRPSSNSLYTTALVANSDGLRARLYDGTSGGIASAVARAAGMRQAIPGLGEILSGGVYRYTTLHSSGYRVYLPVVLRQVR